VRLILLRDRGLGINEKSQLERSQRKEREGSSLSPNPDRPFIPPSYSDTPPPPSLTPLLKIGEAIEKVARVKSEREEKKREVVE